MLRFLKFITALFIIFFLTAAGSVGLVALGMTGTGQQVMENMEHQTSTVFYDRNGKELVTLSQGSDYFVPIDNISPHLINAFLAVEDHRFYRHFGLDIHGMARAAAKNLQERRLVEGGSTITQQLARNLFLSHEKTFSRKIQEALLTLQLERNFSKEEILESYLNTIYFGHGAYGAEAASRTYFGKSANALTLAEASFLAGLPRGPTVYSPYLNLEAAIDRQAVVLSRMEREEFITHAEKEAALSVVLPLQEREKMMKMKGFAAYFIDHLLYNDLPHLLPPEAFLSGELHIYTTLDTGMQKTAEKVLLEKIPMDSTDEHGVPQPQAALIALDPRDGSVRAMLGGKDYNRSQYNRAVPPSGKGRSPGSAFKPFVYAAALENGYNATTSFHSKPVSFTSPDHSGSYEPSEYGGKYYDREISIREALAISSNVIAVKTHMDIGADKSAEMAARLGITSPLNSYPSLPLGPVSVSPLEMAAAYAAFANGGQKVNPYFVNTVKDGNGNVLYQAHPHNHTVLDPRIAYLVTDMLKGVLREGGTGERLAQTLNRPAAAKTGTSEGHRDSYIVGYTPDLVASLWIGNDDNSSLGWGQTGARLAGPVWAAFMSEALANVPVSEFSRPDGLVVVDVCPETGLLHNPRCEVEPVSEIFIAGTQPAEQCKYPDCPHCPPERQWDLWWFLR